MTSCARHQAARGSPRWGPPDLKFWGLSAGTGKLCIFGHLGLVFIWSCFVSCLLLLLYYVIRAPVLTEGTKFWAVAGLHVTSQQPCWWSRTKAFLSSGNLTPFSCKFFQKNFYCIDYQHTTNMAPLSRGCKPRILDENFIGLESYLEAEILMRGLPLYNLFVGEKKKKTVILE